MPNSKLSARSLRFPFLLPLQSRPPSDGQIKDEELEEGSEGDSDAPEDGESSFGKRKADDFLRRQERSMDSTFKASVVIPGDDVTAKTTRSLSILYIERSIAI